MTQPDDGSVQLDVTHMYPYKIFTWKIDHSVSAPQLGINLHQRWPYAPYHQMIVSLQDIPTDVAQFLSLTMLTLLILGDRPRLGQMALLAGLFAMPFWALMAGGVPLPESVLPAQFAEAQVKALPYLAPVPLVLAIFVLRKQSRVGIGLVLALMALLMLGHPLLQLVPEEAKRESMEATAQAGFFWYAGGLAVFVIIRAFFRRWLRNFRARRQQANQPPRGGGDVQEQL